MAFYYKKISLQIDISLIDDFEGHPFTVKDNEKMEELARSIEKNGILNPIIVRKKDEKRYEIIAGHRRKPHTER